MKSSTDRQTDRTEQLLISRFSGSHPFGLLLKNGYHFEDIFEVILLFENLLVFWLYIQIEGLLCHYSLPITLSQRSHLSGCKIEAETKMAAISQIIKTPNWLALTPLEYTLPYHLKQILFCGLLYKKPRVVILLSAFSNSFPLWKLLHFDYELTLRSKKKWSPFANGISKLMFVCVKIAVLWLYIHNKTETNWPPFYREHFAY